MRSITFAFLSIFLFNVNSAFSGIVYTDVIPDLQTIPSSTAAFDVDMDNNNSPDFRFTCVDVSGLQFIIAQAGQIGTSNFVLIDTTGGNLYARALATNANITPASTVWHSMAASNPTLFTGFLGTYAGLWLNSQDYFLGVKFLIGSNYHYGWIRMNINQTTGVTTLKDYAYEDQPNVQIQSGALPGADVATNIVAVDTAENSNGLDMHVSFDKATDENTVDEYRIIVVKDSVTTFDLTTAQSLPVALYEAVQPNGNNVAMVLTSNSKDSDGDDIGIGIPYKVFVMSKADTSVIPYDGLSQPSNTVQLNTTAQVGISLQAGDIDNNGNGTDLELTMTRASKETGISTYRIIVVKSDSSSFFTLTDAENAQSGRYFDIIPNGSNIQTNFPSLQLDYDGHLVQEGIPYKIFSLSLADGTDANINALSNPSNEITLEDKPIGINETQKGTIDLAVLGNRILINGLETESDFILLDQSGRVILKKKISTDTQAIDCSEIHGIFIVMLRSENNQHTQKIYLE